jgi:hypothetical protein
MSFLVCSEALAIEGRAVAQHQDKFVAELARNNAVMSDELATWLDGAVDPDCRPKASHVDGEGRQRLLKVYIQEICKPWLQLWDDATAPCEAEPPAPWCNDESAASEHIDLAGYFSTTIDSLKAAKSDIARDALMRFAVGTLGAHVVTEFRQSDVENWAAGCLEPYARSASPTGMLWTARELEDSWVPKSARIADILLDYVKRTPTLNAEQRDTLMKASERCRP